MAKKAKKDAKIKEFVTKTVKRELAPARIVGVNTREDVCFYDGELLYRIDVVIDGDNPEPRKSLNLINLVHEYFWDNGDERCPLFTFLGSHEVDDYYASARPS